MRQKMANANLHRQRLSVIALACSLIVSSMPGVVHANDSRTPSPPPSDPLWPCIGAAAWEYTLWNDDGSVKAGYPVYLPAKVACKPPQRVGPWGQFATSGGFSPHYPQCNKPSETWADEDLIRGFNKAIDNFREWNTCIYLADAAYRLSKNLQPVYQWGEACTDAASNSALIFPYATKPSDLPKKRFDPDNYGMDFIIEQITVMPPEPYCGGKVDDTPSNYLTLFAKHACKEGENPVNKPVGEGTCVPTIPPDFKPDCADLIGNPVDASTGHKVKTIADYIGVNGLNFSRTYSSGNPAQGNTAPWGASTELSRIVPVKGETPNRYAAFAVVDQSGAQVAYQLQSNNSLTPMTVPEPSKLALITQSAATPDALVQDSVPSGTLIYITGFTLTKADGSFDQYDYLGTLVSRTSANGNTQTFTFSGNGEFRNLATITDFTGRKLTFTYNDRNQLVQMTDPAGKAYLYEYAVDVEDRSKSVLTKVTYPDQTSIQYTYVPGTSRLASSIDQMNVVQNSVTYSTIEPSHATSTQKAGGVDGYTFNYTPYGGTYQDPDLLIVETTDSLNNVSYRKYEKINGRRRLTAQDQPAGSGCAAAISYATYTSAGRKASQDDFNGVRTCFISSQADADRDLDTSVIEGLPNTATCGASLSNFSFTGTVRAKTTQWHPDAALPLKVASPRRMTQYVYNGQPDPSNGGAIASCMPGVLGNGKAPLVLCKTIENATTDLTGAAGLGAVIDSSVATVVSSYTYNADGQVLTAKSPSGGVTQFAYYPTTGAGHTKGDLASITNPSNQVTTFLSYNAHGDLLQSRAINGLVTTMTYDDMRRLRTASAGGLTETYEYTPFGAVDRIMAANGGVTQFQYDAAQRLQSITDPSGNVRTFTMNTAGGVTNETVRDAQGVIARRVTREFDALNRVKQITGAR